MTQVPVTPTPSPSGSADAGAFAPFRPRRGRTVAGFGAVLSVLVFGLVAVFLPSPINDGAGWRVGDKIFFAGVGIGIALLLWRYATIKAVPTRESLTVRNLMTTRTVSWQEIADVRFSGGDPWVSIDLSDTETIAIMAIQKADAEFGRAEAGRLAALIQVLGPSAQSPDAPAAGPGPTGD